MGKYYALFLNVEESRDPRKKGSVYALENEDRWVDVTEFKEDFMCGYDKGVSVFYYNNRAYTVYKEYALVERGDRIFVACDLNLAHDDRERMIKEGIIKGDVETGESTEENVETEESTEENVETEE